MELEHLWNENKELKDKIIQLGIKLGEFLISLPAAIITADQAAALIWKI